MIFRRRHKLALKHRLRDMLWPRMSFRRVADYYRHRMGRMQGTPYFIAAGLATGVAVSMTPFMGFHIALGALLCFMLRASMVAMVVGTLAGNPWTFPFIWMASFKLGKLMLGYTHSAAMRALDTMPAQFTLSHLLDHPARLLLPLMLGSLPLMMAVWPLVYYTSRRAVIRYKNARRQRIHSRSGKREKKA